LEPSKSKSKSLSGSSGKDDFDFDFDFENVQPQCIFHQLLRSFHFEYPLGINLPDRSSDEVGRKIVGRLSMRF